MNMMSKLQRLFSAVVHCHLTNVRTMAKGIDYLHVDTPENKCDTPFEFTAENLSRIESIRACYPDGFKHSPIIAVLDLAQRQNGGWLPLSAMNKVAEILKVERMRVYEVASFYSMFHRKPSKAKYRVNVCTTTPCWLRNAHGIRDKFKEKIAEMPNPEDFEIAEVECLGACCNAPMVQINDDYHEDLSVNDVPDLVEAIANRSASVGPINNKRHGSEPIDHKTNAPMSTTLNEEPRGPGFGVRSDL
ncbi:hypothetical protein ACOME3_005893 [Neoechinorhynchus agilis]